jgi:hypothetical protein
VPKKHRQHHSMSQPHMSHRVQPVEWEKRMVPIANFPNRVPAVCLQLHIVPLVSIRGHDRVRARQTPRLCVLQQNRSPAKRNPVENTNRHRIQHGPIPM